MSLFDGLGKDVISFFDDRAQQVSAAAQTVSTLALGGNLKLLKKTVTGPLKADRRSRTITLELLNVSYGQAQAPTAQAAPATSSTSTSIPANQLKVIANVTAAAKSQSSTPSLVMPAISLDVAPKSDGWPQRLSYRALARQNEWQDAAGFAVLEFGYAIGQLDVDCLVSLGEQPDEAVKKFFDLLYKAKRTRPLANEFPKVLRYHDSYLGKTFIITQRVCELQETADQQGLARLRIQAGILRDYDNPASVALSSLSDSNLIASDAQNVSKDLGGLLSLG